MKISPIILFAYNRPKHTSVILDSLSKCWLFKESKVYIYIDGPKKIINDKIKFKKVCILVNKFKKNNSNIKVYISKKNLGLFKNLTHGISSILKRHQTAIILEDDLQVKKNFLIFMNKSLNLYKKNKKVFQISGYSYPIKTNNNKAYFLNLTSCWGWGIWKDRWQEFERFTQNKKEIDNLFLKIKDNKELKYKFNINNSFNYLKFLKKQINSKFNSWGVLFYLYSFKNNSLNLFPSQSLVNNIGFDGTGLHKSRSNIFNSVNFKNDIKFTFNKRINTNTYNLDKISAFLKSELSLYSKIKKILF
jgi:hypothetical protein